MATPIHRRRLFNGRYTAEEYHQKWGIPHDAKCVGCSNRPLIRAITLMELKEAIKNPAVSEMMTIAPHAFMGLVVKLTGSDGRAVPFVRISCAYACKSCRRDLERAAAKAPSHCVVDFHYGPGADKVVTS